MRLAFTSAVPPDNARPPLRQRATSLILAVAVTLLLILGLLGLNGRAPERQPPKGTLLLDFKPDDEAADTTRKQAAAKPAPRPERAPPPPPQPPAPVPPPPAVPLPTVHPFFIPLTQAENDAADISKKPHAVPGNAAGAQPSQQLASSAGDSRPVGTAPNGEPLYDAEWYRRPTHAELDTYLPKHMPTDGWGLVACRTAAQHHVEDCVELGSSPPGSHLAGAVRQAAWQFLVRPPRLGGKELVGAWVRIRIDYILKRAGNDDAGSDGVGHQEP